MNLNELRDEVHELAKSKGWWDKKPSFGDIIALCHSELSEALEEYRDGKGHFYYKCEFYDTRTACPDRFDGCRFGKNAGCKRGKPEGVVIELADCIIRILDVCGRYGIDIEEAVRVKHEYNKTRPYRHAGR